MKRSLPSGELVELDRDKLDREIEAMQKVIEALKPLDDEARSRIWQSVSELLGLQERA